MTQPTELSILSDSVARAGLFGLLGRLWLAELDVETIAALRSDEVRNALPDWFAIPEVDQLEDVQADFTQLFIGPKDQLPPYQSVWQFGQFEAAPTSAMRTYFDVLGYEPGDLQSSGGMPDHIAIQFDVMSYLLQQVDDSKPAQPELSDMAASFFDDGLSWCMPLLTAVSGRAKTKFYASVARLTGEFLADEATRFGHG